MTVKNESPDGGPVTLAKGTEFLSPEGLAFRSTKAVVVKPAAKEIARGRARRPSPRSASEVWVEAVDKGSAPVVVSGPRSSRSAAPRRDSDDLYGFATSLTRAKQEYWGDDKSYLFDPGDRDATSASTT